MPVRDPASGKKLGVVSTRLRFERLTSLVRKDVPIKVEFVTDQGGYFSEAINAGTQAPPVPPPVLLDMVRPLVRGQTDYCFARAGADYLSLFRLKDYASIDGGGIQVMLLAGEDWLAGEARRARRLEGVALLGVGLLLAAAAGLGVGRAALRRSATWNRLLIEAALDAVVTTDNCGVVQDWNDESEVTFGYTREQAVGRPLADLLFPASLASESRDRICCSLAAGTPTRKRRAEVSAVRRDGVEIAIEMVSAPVPAGGAVWFCVFLRDITERKINQGKLVQAQKLESIGQLAAGIAHEINTPT
jgi:PAS domain S-box-containing protein